MHGSKRILGLIGLALVLSQPVHAEQRVGNFLLLDQHGRAHELHYQQDVKQVLLVSHSTQAKDLAELLATLKSLQNDDTRILLLNSDPRDDRAAVAKQLEQSKQSFTVLMDEGQLIADTLDIEHAGEALLVDASNWQLRFRGPLGKTLQELLAGNKQAEAFVEEPMPKNALALPAQDEHPEISYSDTIAPLLKEKCADCHRPEGIGPWAMTSHTMIKGFAPMIREVVLTGRMPPWHADPHVNSFKEDISLSLEEKQSLVRWIDAGAPRGEGDDPLTEVGAPESEWIFGEPDLVVELPSFDIPATGVVDYQFFEVPNPYPEDVWVRAVQIIPGDRKVLHHAISTFGKPVDPSKPVRDTSGGQSSTLLQEQLMTFVPGNEHYIYPEETGLKLPKGSSFFTQMHYTTSGKASTDKTRIGLYFRDDAPEHVLRHYTIVNTEIGIPPQAGAHQEAAYMQFHQDAVIYSLFPHAHYRGASSEFALRYPDGREEKLLSVPNYDFNWQRYFRLEEPLQVPAGSRLIHRTTYDNSPLNPSNPDPSKTIGWGEQSWDEMLYGGVSFRYLDADKAPPVVDTLQFRTDVTMGFMDKDMDGTLTLAEMSEEDQQRYEKVIPLVDANKNGGLEHEEMKRLLEMRAQQRAQR